MIKERARAAGAVVALLLAATVASRLCESQTPDASSKHFQQQIDEGVELRRAHRTRQSIATLESALADARARNAVHDQLTALRYLALSYRQVPDLPHVLALRLQALDLIRANSKSFNQPFDEEPWALDAVAGAYLLLNRLGDAVQYARQAVDTMTPHAAAIGPVGSGRIRQFLGQLLLLSGNLEESEKYLRLAYDDFEARLNQTGQSGPNTIAEYQFELGVLRWMERLFVAQGRYEDALEITERSRERTMSGVLQLPSTNAGRTLSVMETKAIARQFATTVVVYSVVYALDPDLLLEFSDFVDIPATAVYIWVISPEGSVGFRKVDLQSPGVSLGDLIADARLSIGARGRGAAVGTPTRPSALVTNGTYPALQSLNRILVDPIMALLPKAPDALVMILPQDLLYLVPFAALQDQAGQFLVTRYASFVNYSVAALPYESALLAGATSAARGVLIVGNPAMPSLPRKPGGPPERLPPLPESEKEARAIATYFQATALLGERASKNAIVSRMPSARIVHFATHGIVDRNPDQAQYFDSLAFAPTDGDSGFLTAREIVRMHLAAELAVLSACDTADGKPTGDGVLGLSSAFLAAGVPSVIVAQWSIPDAPTSLLMQTFYDRLLHGLDKARALQQAMLSTMQQHPDPGSWAAFSLFGAPAVAAHVTAIAGDSHPSAAGGFSQLAIPLPSNVQDFIEDDRDHDSGPSASYRTNMTIGQILDFYRDSYRKRGLTEDLPLTDVGKGTASMVMRDSGPFEFVVQIQDMNSDSGTHYVSVRYERRR